MSSYFAQSIARALNTTTTLSTESVDVDINIGNDAVVDEDGAVISPLAPMTDEPIVEAQETALVEEVGEVEETSEEIDSAEGDIETLESIQLHLEKSLTGEGLDTVSYEMLNIAMDSIYRKYGITAAAVMPSMESFGEDRHGQTQVSMEKVTDTLKSVKDGAKEFLKKLWFQIKQLAKNLITFNFSMEKRLNAMAAAAKGIPGNVSAGDIKLYSAKRLLVKGKLPAKNELIRDYDDIVAASKDYGQRMGNYIQTFVENQALILRSDKDNSDQMAKVRESANALAEPFGKLTDMLVFQDAEIVVTTFGRGEDKSVFPGIKLKTAPAPEGEVSNTIAPLSPAEIIAMTAKIKTANANFKAMADTTNNKSVEKLILELAGKDAEHFETVKATREVKKAIKDAISVHGRMMSYFNGVSKAMSDYCAQSLSAYKNSKTDKGDQFKAKDEAAK